MGPVGAGLGQQGGQEGRGEGEEGGLHLHLPPLPGEEGAGGGLKGDVPQVPLQDHSHCATAGMKKLIMPRFRNVLSCRVNCQPNRK